MGKYPCHQKISDDHKGHAFAKFGRGRLAGYVELHLLCPRFSKQWGVPHKSHDKICHHGDQDRHVADVNCFHNRLGFWFEWEKVDKKPNSEKGITLSKSCIDICESTNFPE